MHSLYMIGQAVPVVARSQYFCISILMVCSLLCLVDNVTVACSLPCKVVVYSVQHVRYVCVKCCAVFARSQCRDGVFLVDLPFLVLSTKLLARYSTHHNNKKSLHDESIARFDVIRVAQWPCTDHRKIKR
jgi:hypothetical protein